jgi:hypothetical protein
MKIGVFLQSANHQRFTDTLLKFKNGLDKTSESSFISNSPFYEECDLAVIFGSWKDRDTPWHNTKRSIVENAPNFIVLETPIIGRGPVSDIMQDDWYRIGLNGFLNDTGKFINHDMPNDRWQKIQKELSVELKPLRKPNIDAPIVVVLQLPGDASLRGANITKWAYETCEQIRTFTETPIIVRTPQLQRQFDPQYLEKIFKLKNVQAQQGTKENLQYTLDEASIVVTYSSGMGVESAMNGTHTITWSKSSFAWDVSGHALHRRIMPSLMDKSQWIHNLSYHQWSDEEIEEGTAWSHLKTLL